MSKKVLVVDDDKSILMIAETFLKGKGFSVVTANSGEKALKMADSEKPDIILLDVVMPGISGFEVCEKLKKNRKTRKIKIVIISGNIPEIEKGFDYGADDCIVKPLDWNKLTERLEDL